jgi:hypothetical protein
MFDHPVEQAEEPVHSSAQNLSSFVESQPDNLLIVPESVDFEGYAFCHSPFGDASSQATLMKHWQNDHNEGRLNNASPARSISGSLFPVLH